jgi:hypothetical protein
MIKPEAVAMHFNGLNDLKKSLTNCNSVELSTTR